MIETVFYGSGFKRTLCGSKWDPVKGLTGDKNAFASLGGITARYDCSCLAGTFSVPNDETSCKLCPRGKSSTRGSSSCDLTTIKLPNGNGKPLVRVGNTLGRIVDDILGNDNSKKDAATETYGPIENWDVSMVTDLSGLFYSKYLVSANLSSWDVSRVTAMNRSALKSISILFCIVYFLFWYQL